MRSWPSKGRRAQTKLALAGTTTEQARRLIESLPTPRSLMPELDLEAVTGESITDLLIAPKRRQRRLPANQQRRLPPPDDE
jgi:hypothetical protein